jgi:large subunit ribosomal protein L31e
MTKEEEKAKEQKTEKEPEKSAESDREAETEESLGTEEEKEEKKAEIEEVATEEEPKEAAEAEERVLTGEVPIGEEAKPPAREEKPEEEEIIEERIYTIPLGRAWIKPSNKRAPKAMRIIRSFVTKHMKLEAHKEAEEEEEPKRLIISNEVNERVWERGIEKPPRNIRIRAAKDKEGNITVYLAEGD